MVTFFFAGGPIIVLCCKLKRHWLVSCCCDMKHLNFLKFCPGFRKRCGQKPLKKSILKNLLAWRQLFATYCRFIMQEQRVSGGSMLCQSILKHLCHSNSVMKSVKKRGIWQNVLRTLFYHKCFASQSFLQGCSLKRNYKSVWIFDGSRNRFCLYLEHEMLKVSSSWYLYHESISF